ncbi:hypothetical protein VP01_4522g2 [Puccinia sorghi]|uniref:Uncharacterized protein n=1 Tax=Puccinia sorghi TaxID=27349 RepID=A0A0L6UP03_9BASI|nr:hypothetical protein VP01_4522g2 [Puccinia sorghi]
MPDIYALWVARRAELGRSPPVPKEQNDFKQLLTNGAMITTMKLRKVIHGIPRKQMPYFSGT